MEMGMDGLTYSKLDALAVADRLAAVDIDQNAGSHRNLSAVCSAVMSPGEAGWTPGACAELSTRLRQLVCGAREVDNAQAVAVRTVDATLSLLASVPAGQLDSPYLHEVLHMLHCVLTSPWVLA